MVMISELVINQEDNENANFYLKNKGKDLYMHVIKIFQSKYKNEKKFNYQEISSFIRYDKSLRDILFRYFAYLEENLRAKILLKKDIAEVVKKEKKEIININLIQRTNLDSTSNLYFTFIKSKISFGNLVELCVQNEILNQAEIEDWKNLVKLRNQIMHHNLLLLKNFQQWDKAEKNIKEIKKILKLLIKYLPKKYQKGFVFTINNLVKEKKENQFTRINLGKLNYE
ncbi:MAG: hypothetical protein REH79_02345 [Spiroplasma sp.]|nr:hypothetical protein [Spiroplasma sp.]